MNFDIIRAWKDAHYRNSLNAEEKALLPENPVGEIELTEAHLAGVVGGAGANTYSDIWGTEDDAYCCEETVSDGDDLCCEVACA